MIGVSSHPWMNGLFGDDEIAEVFAAEAELKRFLQIEAAWTQALGQVRNTPHTESVAKAIISATISPHDLKDGFANDGVVIPALVRLLKASMAPDASEWVHTGLTSQDVMDTSLVLALSEVLKILSGRLQMLDCQLEALENKAGAARTMAFTRMQPALETSAAETVSRWRQPLPRVMADLKKIAQTCTMIQWGGPIGVRDHPHEDQLGSAFAKQLGLQDPGQSWHTDRTLIIDHAQLMERITVLTGKIGEDIALMAAVGTQQVALTGGGSSAMPHKNNPVKAETLIALSDLAATLSSTLTRSARHESFRSGRAWTLEWLCLPDICMITGASLIQAKLLLASIKELGFIHQK